MHLKFRCFIENSLRSLLRSSTTTELCIHISLIILHYPRFQRISSFAGLLLIPFALFGIMCYHAVVRHLAVWFWSLSQGFKPSRVLPLCCWCFSIIHVFAYRAPLDYKKSKDQHSFLSRGLASNQRTCERDARVARACLNNCVMVDVGFHTTLVFV